MGHRHIMSCAHTLNDNNQLKVSGKLHSVKLNDLIVFYRLTGYVTAGLLWLCLLVTVRQPPSLFPSLPLNTKRVEDYRVAESVCPPPSELL